MAHQFNNSLFFSDKKAPSIEKNNQNKQFIINQKKALDLENKLSAKEKEIDSSNKSASLKIDLYLSIIDELSQNDKTYSALLQKLKSGLDTVLKQNRKDTDV